MQGLFHLGAIHYLCKGPEGGEGVWKNLYILLRNIFQVDIFYIRNRAVKRYLTQMLLAINWRYWQAGKNSLMHMNVQGRLMQSYFIEMHKVFFF